MPPTPKNKPLAESGHDQDSGRNLSETKEVGVLKGGDYMVHIFVEAAKEIDLKEGVKIDCLFQVMCNKDRKFTSTKHDITSLSFLNFQEHIFFELLQQTPQQLDNIKLRLSLQNRGAFKNELIGEFDIDFSFVYFLKGHTLTHQWFVLSNPASEDFAQVSAYVKVSISISGQDDEPKELLADPSSDDNNVIIPASIRPRYKQLKIHIFRGEDLPKLDASLISNATRGKMDAYIKASVFKKPLSTCVVTTEKDLAEWNQTFLIPVQIPIMAGTLHLQLWDEDLTADELGATIVLYYKDLLEMKTGLVLWKNFYGCPGQEGVSQSGDKKEAKKMNLNPEIASEWKGRILLGIEHADCEHPKYQVEQIQDELILDKAREFSNLHTFYCYFEAHSVIMTPKDNASYSLKLTMGGKTWESYTVNTKKGLGVAGVNFNRWAERSDLLQWKLPYMTMQGAGRIYIYLMYKKKPVSYAKFYATEFMDVNPELKWVQMLPDPVIGKVKSPERAGIIAFKCSIVTEDQLENLQKSPVWSTRIEKRATSFKVRAFIFQCRNLPAADESGTSDPFIRIFDNVNVNDIARKTTKKTKVIKETCYPMFYECIELAIDAPSVDTMPPFVLDVYDDDPNLFLDNDIDYLGRALIQITDCSKLVVDSRLTLDDDNPPRPRWHPFRYQNGGAPCGEVLASFVICDQDYNFRVSQSALVMSGTTEKALVQFQQYQVEINVLGLRGLHSPGLLPIKKSYIEFGLNSLIPPGKLAHQVTNKLTTPGPSGPDPTINTVIGFNTLMPVEDLYTPSMSCRVFDKIFKGLSGQLVGTFTIPLGNVMHKIREEHLHQLFELQNVILNLEKILADTAVPSYKTETPKDMVVLEEFRVQQQQEKKQYETGIKVSKNSLLRSDSDEEEFEQNRVSIQRPLLHSDSSGSDDYVHRTTRKSYLPPKLDDDHENRRPRSESWYNKKKQTASAHSSHSFQNVPRSELTQDERNQRDEELAFQELQRLSEESGSSRISRSQIDSAIRGSTQEQGQIPENHLMANLFKIGISQVILDRVKKEDQRIDQDLLEERKRAEVLTEGNQRFHHFKILAKYQKDERLNVFREIEVPPRELFEQLGWDRDLEKASKNEQNEMHYRRYYPHELEKPSQPGSEPILRSVFDSYEIKRGQTRGANHGFSLPFLSGGHKDAETNEKDTEQVVGKFKGMIIVYQKEEEGIFLEKKDDLTEKLFSLLNQIHEKKFKKQLPCTRGDVIRTLNAQMVKHQTQKRLEENQDSDSVESNDEEDLLIAHGNIEPPINDKYALDTKTGRIGFRQLMIKMELQHLRLTKNLLRMNNQDIVKRMLVQKNTQQVTLYALSCFNLAQRDIGSASDPYVKVLLGKDIFDDRKNYQEDEPNPDLFKKIVFRAEFPGCPLLQIQLWDWDKLFGDDLIGETQVDLEDRYFSPEWNSLDVKPIEYRKLYHPTSQMDQGVIKCWIEIDSQQAANKTTWDITPKPAEEFEVRIVVWDTKDLKMMDVEGTTDGFIVCDLNEVKRETDTHFRNTDGHCSFNYRLLFRVKYCANSTKEQSYNLRVQAYDKDFFKSNDLIGEDNIDLKPLIEDASAAGRAMALTKVYYKEYLQKEKNVQNLSFEDDQDFWVKMKTKNKGKIICNGSVRMQIQVYPAKDATEQKVGDARQEPNINPFLPVPVGRLKLTLNPLKLLSQLVGPEFRRKFYCILCSIACCVLTILLFPMIMSTLVGSALSSIV